MSDDPTELLWKQLLSEPKDSVPEKNAERFLTEKESSTISWVSYSAPKLTLAVRFRTSPRFRYVFYGVPKDIGNDFFQTLKEGRSVGRFFKSKIQGHYSFLKEEIDKAT